MSIKDKLIDAFLKGTIDRAVQQRLKAASILGAPSIEELKWRPLTSNVSRDLLPVTQDRMIEIAYWLWETNPMAGWLIDITTAFIMAEGLPYETEDDNIKEVLDGFWNDPINRMDLFFPKHISELHIFGELCMPAFTAEQTGRMHLGYIDPAQIDAVITDPENVKMQIGIFTKRYVGDVGGIHIEVEPKQYKIILPEEAQYVLSPTGKKLYNQFSDGECFYSSINNVTNSPRGRSSLLSTADWLDAYEQYLFDYADRWPLLNTFVWDLMVQGGDDTEIKKQMANFSKKSGSIFGHNEKVTAEAKAPDLKTMDAEKGARIFRNHILGRWGYPEHWYGGGGDVNRATASEMDMPAIKMLTQKQNQVKYIMQDILGYQIRQAKKSGYLRSGDVNDFSIVTPQMQAKDVSKFGATIQQVAASLVSAEMQQWIDKDTARKIFGTAIGFIGIEIDYEEVKAALEEQNAIAGYEDYLKKKGPPHDQTEQTAQGAVRRVK